MVTLIALTATLLLCAPAQAFAKSYSCPEVTISAQAQTDASIHVVEQRTFDFNGSFSAVWWTFDDLPNEASITVNSMRVAQVDSSGNVLTEWATLPQAPFQTSWRSAGGPSHSAWSYDQAELTAYAFFNVTDARMVVEFDYTVVNGILAYDDVAELYWQYIPSGWAVPSENVTATISLPVLAGSEVVPGDNVRAWGHGPLDGTVLVEQSGTVVYEVPYVNAGQYAEARIVFPVSWLTNASSSILLANQGTTALDSILAEEQVWADKANNERILVLGGILVLVALCVVVLAAAILLFLRYGREHKPDFTDDYWRDVPEKGMQPAVAGRLWRWNRESADDFTATIMSLAHKGAVRIEKGSYTNPKGKVEDDYYLTCVDSVAEQLSDPIEVRTLSLLFNYFGGGAKSIWFGTIREFGKNNPERYQHLMENWQGTLTAEVNKYEFFETKGKVLQSLIGGLAGVLIVGGGIVSYMMMNFIPLIPMTLTGIMLILIANYMPRRTVYGNNIVARSKALRNWLKDFSSLDERPPTDVKVWGEFMVYAYLFGVADQAMKELRKAVPELFVEDLDAYGTNYVPWYVWYSAGHNMDGALMPSVSEVLNSSVANTLSSAQAALSAANANMSGAGGFGGGFSIGGGGGFGGGGGAR